MRQIRVTPFMALAVMLIASNSFAGHTNNIMVTGYWPPTNDMVRHFSTNPKQNPDGWQGENWESSGYNIHSFFPEFPLGVDVDPRGEGDFEVDYQDTSEDWWRITSEINPVAIITFSRGAANSSWEIEAQQRNWRGPSWVPDYDEPFRPTPNPPDSTIAPNAVRPSTLPMEAIMQSVNDADLGVSAQIDMFGGGGRFLSEYIAYHGVWYQDIHSDPSDPFQSVAAGHIHVGQNVSVDQGILATEISLRTLITHVNSLLVPEPSSLCLLFMACVMLVQSIRRL